MQWAKDMMGAARSRWIRERRGPFAKCIEKSFLRMVRSNKDHKALEPVKMSSSGIL